MTVDQRAGAADVCLPHGELRDTKGIALSPIATLYSTDQLAHLDCDCIEKQRYSQPTRETSQKLLATTPIMECYRTIIAGCTQARSVQFRYAKSSCHSRERIVGTHLGC